MENKKVRQVVKGLLGYSCLLCKTVVTHSLRKSKQLNVDSEKT